MRTRSRRRRATNSPSRRPRRGRHADALQAYRQALELDRQSSAAWTGVRALLMDLGRREDARTAFVRAVDADPKSAEARYQLAFALSALGDYQGALRETKRALELDPYFPTPRFRLLIDLQFEEGRVLAPDLDVARDAKEAGEDAPFEVEQGALDAAFAGLIDGGGESSPAGATAATADGAGPAADEQGA